MSYTPPNQDLDPAKEKIIEGIKDFIRASNERINDYKRWNKGYLEELMEINIELQKLMINLDRL